MGKPCAVAVSEDGGLASSLRPETGNASPSRRQVALPFAMLCLAAVTLACAALLLGGCASDAASGSGAGSAGSASSEAPVASASEDSADGQTSQDGLGQGKGSEAVAQQDATLALLADPQLQGSLCVIEYIGNSVAFVKGGQVIGRIPVGVNPAAVVSSADGSRLYIANSGNGEVVRLDLGERPAVTKARIGTQPMALALDEERGLLYAADYHLNSIRIVDTELMSLVGSVALDPAGYENREMAPACCSDPLDGTVMTGRKPLALALSSDGLMLYTANIGTYDVSRVDLDAREELSPFDGVIGSWGIALSPDGSMLALAGVGSELIGSSELIVMDAATGERLAAVPVGAQVSAVDWSADGSVVVATSREEGVLAVIDGASLEPVGTVALDEGLAAVAVSEDGRTAYAASSLTGVVSTVDVGSLTETSRTEGLVDTRFMALVGEGR